MAGKISVIGDVGVSATLGAGARGADVIVAAAGSDVAAAARLAPAAVLVLVDASADQVAAALSATLWPRQRVVGVAAADAERAVRAVAEGAPVALRATLRDGSHDVVIGPGGVRLA
ncbi:MAG TPA: hypothetical protein VF549_20305 [Solirubrobacteraceae bacterium]